jgi:hypothetical protein
MSARLGYKIDAGEGKVLISWTMPIRYLRMPWAKAYSFAKEIADTAQRAEVQAGLTLDHTTPERIHSVIGPEGDRVKVDWGLFQLVFIWEPGIALAMADALVKAARIAQRWGTQGPGMTPKEVDRVEEALLGDPALTISSAGKRAQEPFLPLVGQTYYYRPADEMARVLALFPTEHRANILLMSGRLLEGIAWADLLAERPVEAMGIPSAEAVDRPTLSGS